MNKHKTQTHTYTNVHTHTHIPVSLRRLPSIFSKTTTVSERRMPLDALYAVPDPPVLTIIESRLVIEMPGFIDALKHNLS